MNFRTTGYFRVATVQKESEILALVEAVAALKPAVIVEIGTANGGTCFLWANLASKKVISCDLKHSELSRNFYSAFPPPDSTCEVTLLTGDSHQQAMKDRLLRELDGERIDFLFIDGDHTELGVERDYHMYRDFVRPDGLIAFHDIVEKQPLASNQVYHFWKRLREKTDTKEFIDDADQCGFGIGIVRHG
ncbi:MAG: O-methyltransferase [Gammaproteobacteria bacterium]